MPILPIIFIIFFFNFSVFSDSLSFIYVNANSGQSGGGHSGLKLGDYLYHFQYYDDKIFHLVREDWKQFFYLYNSVDNRKIVEIELDVRQEEFEKIRDRWNEAFLIQQSQLDYLHSLNKEYEFLKSISEKRSISLPFLGYFKFHSFHDILSEEIAMDFSGNNRFQILKSTFIHKEDTLHEKFERTLQKNFLEFCIKKDCELESDSLICLDEYLKIDEKKQILEKFKKIEKLHRAFFLKETKISKYNFEKANIIKYIRLQYIKKSINENKIYIPDSYSIYSKKVQKVEIANSNKLKKIFGIVLANAIKVFISKTDSDMESLLYLEDPGNRYHELFQKSSTENRVQDRLLFPEKERLIEFDEYNKFLSEIDSNTLSELKKRRDDTLTTLRELYPFHLLRENCTTEVFSTLNSTFDGNRGRISNAMGGYIDGKEGFNFIPFVARNRVRSIFRVRKVTVYPSFRNRKLESLSNTENFLKVEIKESNTFSSSLYRRNSNDGFFIFFTDRNRYLRPVFGLVNVLAGSLQVTYGILSYPVTGGRDISPGFAGILDSLPEIFFFNIRKGTFIDTDEFQSVFFGENE